MPSRSSSSRLGTLPPCMGYSAAAADTARLASGFASLSTLLVGEEMAPHVGRVEVRGLQLRHAALGALRITLQWLPYSDSPVESLPSALTAVANATSILKDVREGGEASNIGAVTFSDGANSTIGLARAADNLTGAFRPATPLAVFAVAKLSSRARWVLGVEDVAEGRESRPLELLGWTLVLCPAAADADASSMAQQALPLEALGSALGAGVGARAAELFGAFGVDGTRTLSPATGSAVTVTATTDVKSYSELADDAVEEYITATNNLQTLLGLPYEPTPLIDQALPWIELLTGLTEISLNNNVWPGKIVYYALQLEVFARMREAMSAGSSTGNSTAGNSTTPKVRSGSTSGNCGLIEGPAGPTMVNKRLLQRDMCRYMMPPQFAQYAQPGGPVYAPGSTPAATPSSTPGAARSSTPSTPSFLPDWLLPEGDEEDADGAGNDTSADPFLQRWVQSLGLGTDATPLSFTLPRRFRRAGRGVRAPAEVQRAFATPTQVANLPFREESQQPGLPAWYNYNVQERMQAIITDNFENLDTSVFNNALEQGVERLARTATNVQKTMEDVVKSSPIERAGDNAMETAKAMQKAADTYVDVIKAAQDQMKRLKETDLANKTREWLKDGGPKKDNDGMNGASNAGSAFRNPFTFQFNRVRLAFRFAPKDGFQVTYQQNLYLLSDVQQIQSLANQLEALDRAANGGYDRPTRRDRNGEDGDGNGPGGKTRSAATPSAGPASTPSSGPASTASASSTASSTPTGGRARPRPASLDRVTRHLPNGQTLAEFWDQAAGGARRLAQRAFANIPPETSSGFDRVVGAAFSQA